jgi:hypothetical protein
LFPNLNDIIRAKGNIKKTPGGKRWDAYQAMKQKWGWVVSSYASAQGFARIDKPSHFEFEFIEPNRKRDPDGVASGAMKLILDGLQASMLLKNDNAEWVLSLLCTFKYQKEGVGVMLTVK